MGTLSPFLDLPNLQVYTRSGLVFYDKHKLNSKHEFVAPPDNAHYDVSALESNHPECPEAVTAMYETDTPSLLSGLVRP